MDYLFATLDEDMVHPLVGEALAAWRKPQFIKCCLHLCALEQEHLTDWDCYQQMCVDCYEHDKCFV